MLTAGGSEADGAADADLTPLGIAPPAGISGVSLAPLMTGAKRELGLDAYSEAMYPLHHYGWSDLHALRAGRYKILDAPRIDEAKALAQADKVMGFERDVKKAHLGALIRIRNVLTDAQRAKLAALRAKQP